MCRACRACFGVGELEMFSSNDFVSNPHPTQRDSHPSATDNTHRGRRERARAVEERRSRLWIDRTRTQRTSPTARRSPGSGARGRCKWA